MFSSDSSTNIWVSTTPQSKEDGSRGAPFSSISKAIDAARPGSTVVISEGVYSEQVSINERRGEETSPITVMADPDAESVILKGEWYLYEVSDFIISGLTFVDTKNSALSLVGESNRNSIKECLFINCGESAECTLFLGGSGGQFTVIENSQFTRVKDGVNMAILIAQSQDTEDENSYISTNTAVRYSTFENYTVGVLLGSGDDIEAPGNHIVKECLFVECDEGIRCKANASEIQESIFRDCKIGLNQVAGTECQIEDNRFEGCESSMVLSSLDVTVTQNCFVDSPIKLNLNEDKLLITVISNNTFIFSDKKSAVETTGCGKEFSVIVSDNLLYNGHIADNTAMRLHQNEFFEDGGVEFEDMTTGDFRCDSLSVGCKRGATFRTKIAPLPTVDYSKFEALGDSSNLSKMDQRDLYLKSLFIINEDDADESPMEAYDDGEDDGEFYDYED